MKTYIFIPIFLLILAFNLIACDEGEAPPDSPEPNTAVPNTAVSAAAEATETPIPVTETSTLAVTGLEEVKEATIRIESQGSFVDPQFGPQLNVAGGGSGFIIDESGRAVTNNHVVTGAATLKVWVGDEEEPRNARVLGASECSDLAVIEIDGDDFPYLQWYDGQITTGLDVYAAGFPLGDPEFTLTRGIVSKEQANGQTSWAAVTAVIEHDATINPGSSGGPLVTTDGQVVAVNYAGNSNFNQYFAIAQNEALAIIEQLQAGENVDALGINGVAVNDGESLFGIWVNSVASGSAADKAGLMGGDIITMMEGILLATEGTMADYCEVVRSHQPEDTLSIKVIRMGSGERLEGQLNGRPLELLPTTFVDGHSGTANTGPTTYASYVTVTDDTGAIVIEVPQEWHDLDGSIWEEEGIAGASIVASPNLEEMDSTHSTPGVIFAAMVAQSYDEASLLDDVDLSDDCTYENRFEYADPLYTGLYDLYSNCGGVGSRVVNLAAVPAQREFIMLVQIKIVSDADLEALDRILNTFEVIGDLPVVGSLPGYVTITDDTNAIQMDVPQEWHDIVSTPWELNDEVVGVDITVSPNSNDFWNSFATSGIFLGVSKTLVEQVDEVEILDVASEGGYGDECSYEGRDDYDDGLHTGIYDFYSNCGEAGATLFLLVVTPPDRSYLALIIFQAMTEEEVEEIGLRIIESFSVVGELPNS